jgi:uncharacterized membrane protein (GlpM family)
MTPTQIILRFLIGGASVIFFSLVGRIVRPKSFAGLFGAAPSVALASLSITIINTGKSYAGTECHYMMAGAVAFLAYAAAVLFVLRRHRHTTLHTTIALMPIWFIVAFTLRWLWSF